MVGSSSNAHIYHQSPYRWYSRISDTVSVLVLLVMAVVVTMIDCRYVSRRHDEWRCEVFAAARAPRVPKNIRPVASLRIYQKICVGLPMYSTVGL